MSVSTDRVRTPGEVAELFVVDPKTVIRWAPQGADHAVHDAWRPPSLAPVGYGVLPPKE